MEQGFGADEMDDPHHDHADDREDDEQRDRERQPCVSDGQIVKPPEHQMGQMYGDQKDRHDEQSVDADRTERMHAAQPSATQGLHIEFLEEADAQADQDGVDDAEGDGTTDGERRQPAKRGEYGDCQQDRDEFPAGRDGEGDKFQTSHRSRILPIGRAQHSFFRFKGEAHLVAAGKSPEAARQIDAHDHGIGASVAGLPRETQMTTLTRETEVQLGSAGSVLKMEEAHGTGNEASGV